MSTILRHMQKNNSDLEFVNNLKETQQFISEVKQQLRRFSEDYKENYPNLIEKGKSLGEMGCS
ncbi:hypothetical protein [Alkalibacillus haloalkaliphilus]|uniref:hypothetical protein n=1 Tax=Alkalibacillus haloalkaliphilus TaxID=94136 RepID=UPI000374773F|nr:hypothetical protein [Alkalibacillus haloalkaliphilus]